MKISPWMILAGNRRMRIKDQEIKPLVAKEIKRLMIAGKLISG